MANYLMTFSLRNKRMKEKERTYFHHLDLFKIFKAAIEKQSIEITFIISRGFKKRDVYPLQNSSP